MKRAMLVAAVMWGGVAGAGEVPDEDAVYARIEASNPKQRLVLSSLACAAGMLRTASKALVKRERRMARETVYVRPQALREARRLLEKVEEWEGISRKQLRDRRATAMTCKSPLVAKIAICMMLTETDAETPAECSEPEPRAALKWALAEEESE